MARLEIDRVTKRYGDFHAVRDVDLDVADGEFVVLLGPSGCGKTTTLRIIAGFVEPTAGAVRLGAADITQLAAVEAQRRSRVPELRAVPAPDRRRRTSPSASRCARSMRCRNEPGASPRRCGSCASSISASACRGSCRAASSSASRSPARSCSSPDVLLLDEPLSNLDAKLRQEVRVEIRELQRKLGLTTVMVTHDQEEALTMADRLVVMNDGAVRQVGTQQDLYERPADTFVAGFVGPLDLHRGRSRGARPFPIRGRPRSLPAMRTPTARRRWRCGPSASPLDATAHAGMDNSLPGVVEFVSYLGAAVECMCAFRPRSASMVQVAEPRRQSCAVRSATRCTCLACRQRPSCLPAAGDVHPADRDIGIVRAEAIDDQERRSASRRRGAQGRGGARRHRHRRRSAGARAQAKGKVVVGTWGGDYARLLNKNIDSRS